MSVMGASENRFTHWGSTETHFEQLPDPSDYDHAFIPFPVMKRLDASVLVVWHDYVVYVGCVVCYSMIAAGLLKEKRQENA